MQKVSYCITCKGRLYHLKETLSRNLEAEKNDPDVQFILLNYQSEDGMAEWVQDTFPEEIESGRLVHVYHAPAPHFRMAHAKNMSHRVATGEILCNIDADNVIANGFASWLRAQFDRDPSITISSRRVYLFGWFIDRILLRGLGIARPPAGLSGRIAIRRENFYKLGGYSEVFSAWGSDDLDFQLRGRDAGIKPKRLPKKLWGSVITHDDEARMTNLSETDQAASSKRLGENLLASGRLWVRKIRTKHEPYPNVTGEIGCGDVWINYAPDPEHLAPLHRPV